MIIHDTSDFTKLRSPFLIDNATESLLLAIDRKKLFCGFLGTNVVLKMVKRPNKGSKLNMSVFFQSRFCYFAAGEVRKSADVVSLQLRRTYDTQPWYWFYFRRSTWTTYKSYKTLRKFSLDNVVMDIVFKRKLSYMYIGWHHFVFIYHNLLMYVENS